MVEALKLFANRRFSDLIAVKSADFHLNVTSMRKVFDTGVDLVYTLGCTCKKGDVEMPSHSEWMKLKDAISKCPESERYLMQPKLDDVIRRLKAEGAPIPVEVRQLNSELQAEAVEAQFDNVPV